MTDFERPRGTRDFGPDEMASRRRMEARLRSVFERWGYREVATPTFEHLELFTTKSGEGIVEQLYHFTDKGDRELTLRPELTAPVLRYYVSDLQMEPKPLRLFYYGNCFRYERPQSGRYREFWQFGVELIGSPEPEAEAEVIALAAACVRSAGVDDHLVRVGHIDVLRPLVEQLPESARAETYRRIDKDDPELAEFLEGHGATPEMVAAITTLVASSRPVELAGPPDDVEARLDVALDGVRTATGQLSGQVPDEALARVEQGLRRLSSVLVALGPMLGDDGVTLDLGVARGLDYYTGVVFEIEAPKLGAEKQVLGGGVYALSELFGGNPVDSVGFGLGFDRVLLAGDAGAGAKPVDAHIVPIGDAPRERAARIANELRTRGLSVTLDVNRRKPGKNLDYANSIDARHAVLLGSKELERNVAAVKHLATGEQVDVELDKLADHLKG